MGIFKSAANYLGVNGSAAPAAAPTAAPSAAPRVRNVTPLRARRGASEGTEINTFDPTSYADAREIAEVFRDGVSVIVNLSAMSEADAAKLTHFLFGLKEGLQGHIKRIDRKIFVLTPYHVDLNDEEDQADLSDGIQAL